MAADEIGPTAVNEFFRPTYPAFAFKHRNNIFSWLLTLFYDMVYGDLMM